MLRAERVEHQGHWPAAKARGSVTLAFDERHRRRLRLVSDAGEEFLLDLAHAQALAEGDGLALSDGGWIAVRAAPEALLEIRGRSAHHLLRLAWHLGNRHLPTQIEAERILIRRDHVIAAMLHGLGAAVHEIEAPFTPEHGAYAAGGHHDQDHEHGHAHD